MHYTQSEEKSPSPDHGRDGGMNVGGRGGFIDKLMTVFVAFALLGLGCKEKVLTQTPAAESADAGAEAEREAEDVKEERADAGAPDSGSVIPEGWQVYRNPAWGIAQLAYPEGWYYAELPFDAIGDANVHIVVLNPEPFTPLLHSDPPYPLTIEVVRAGSINEEIKYIDGIESQSQVIIGGTMFTRVRYISELIDDVSETYITEANGSVYSISGNPKVVELETIAASFATEVR
ncbi:hypothetical protein HYW17_01885 [Candidatus Uhrbacteria bacterium]|nr:hypothetical protein [Candidatus Uhrbacteria bacterium]